MRGSVFKIKEALNIFGLVCNKSMISTPSHKTKDVGNQILLVETFVVGITKHRIIRILQQSAVTGLEGVSM